MRITGYGWAVFFQIIGVVAAVTFLGADSDGFWSNFLGLVGVFVALDATEHQAVLRARGANTDLFERTHKH